MSKASTEVKVLQVALKRVEAGRWGKSSWQQVGHNVVNGEVTHLLCIEGSVTNGSREPKTVQQVAALERLRGVMRDWHNVGAIPTGNDHHGFTHQMAIDLIREALRRAKGEKADRARRTGPNMEQLMTLVEQDQTTDAFEELIEASDFEPDFSNFGLSEEDLEDRGLIEAS